MYHVDERPAGSLTLLEAAIAVVAERQSVHQSAITLVTGVPG